MEVVSAIDFLNGGASLLGDAGKIEVIRKKTLFGMDSYLYVSPNKQEWETERALLKRGETFAYVINRDVPWCSEVGWIAFKSSSGAGLIRTA